MKFSIKNVDKMLENFFESNLLFKLNKNPLTLLSEELIQVFEKNVQNINGQLVAPNVFSIFIGSKYELDKNDLQGWELFAKQLIKEICEENSYSLAGPININFSYDEYIINNFKIMVDTSGFLSGDTIKMSPDSLETETKFEAHLILWDEEIFKLSNKMISIGRQPDNDVIIDNLRVSRTHAQIRWVKNCLFIIDHDSASGTYVNGQKIKQHQLANGDVIEIADVPLIVCIGESGVSTKPQSSQTKILKIIENRDGK